MKITTKHIAREFLTKFYSQRKDIPPSLFDSLSVIVENVILLSNPHEDVASLDDSEFVEFLNSSSMSVQFLKQQLKRQYLSIVHTFFSSSRYNKVKGISRAYKLKDEVVEKLVEFILLTKDVPAVWVSENGRVINRIEYGILRADENNKRIKSTIDIAGLVPVNVDLLDECMKIVIDVLTSQAVTTASREYLQSRGIGVGIFDRGGKEILLQSLWKMYTLRRLSLKHNAFPQLYIESGNGRITGVGYNLQNTIGKRIRRIALSNQNLVDYDMEASTPTIFVSLASKYGLTAPAMENYLHNKSSIRNDLSAKYDIKVSDIKEAINALFYGVSKRLEGPKEYRTSLLKIFKSKSTTVDFLKDEFVRDILSERKLLYREILRHARTSRGRVMFNVMQKGVSLFEISKGRRKKRASNKLVSHIVLGYEALIIQTTVQILKERGTKIHLLVSDGFVADEIGDLQVVENEVKEKLKAELPNLKLKFSMERLQFT